MFETHQSNSVIYDIPTGLASSLINSGSLQSFTCIGWAQVPYTMSGPFNQYMFSIQDGSGASIIDFWFNSGASTTNPLGNWFSYLRGTTNVFRAITGRNYPDAGSVMLYAIFNSPSQRRMMLKWYENGVSSSTFVNGTADTIPSGLQQPAQLVFNQFTGARAGFAIRNHEMTQSDFEAVWDSRKPQGIFDVNNTASGGNMNGRTGVLLAFDNGMLSSPIFHGAGFSGSANMQPRAIVGQPIQSAMIVYDRFASSNSTQWEVTRPVRLLHGTSGLPKFVAPEESRWNHGFWMRSTVSGAFQSDVPGGTLGMRRLIMDRPSGLTRVAITERSRASYAGIGGNGLPNNYTAGMMASTRYCAGVDLIPPVTPQSNPFYDLSFSPKQSAQLTVLAGDSAQNTICRFAWGQNPGVGIGNGNPVVLGSSQTLRLMVKPYQLLTPEKEMRQVIHYFAMPGTSQVRWRRATDTAQTRTPAETLGQWSEWIDTSIEPGATVTLDSTMASSYNGAERTIVLAGVGLGVKPGMVAVRGSSYDVANVATVEEDGDTTLTFDHPFATAPSSGENLVFGGWDYRKLVIDHSGIARSSDDTWRGVELECNTTGKGLVMLGVGAWALKTDGWVFISLAMGGLTTTQQIAAMNVTGPDGESQGPKKRFWREVGSPDVFLVFDNDTVESANEEIVGLALEATQNRNVAGVGSWFNSDAHCNALRSACVEHGLAYVQVRSQGGDSSDWYVNGYWDNGSVHQSASGATQMIKEVYQALRVATSVFGEPESGGEDFDISAMEKKLNVGRSKWDQDFL